jgi:hypothetical protein
MLYIANNIVGHQTASADNAGTLMLIQKAQTAHVSLLLDLFKAFDLPDLRLTSLRFHLWVPFLDTAKTRMHAHMLSVETSQKISVWHRLRCSAFC